jgi:hypothetical protein
MEREAAAEASGEALRARLNGALRAPLAARDREVGLAPEGPVISALEQATYDSPTPGNGRAVFDVTVSADGEVVALDLVDASEGRAAWEGVARAAHAAARAKRLAMRGGGARIVRIEVESRIVMPSGADPGVEVDVLGVPVKKGEGPHPTLIDILNPGRPMFPLGITGDVSDIGAKRRRIVHAHAVGER